MLWIPKELGKTTATELRAAGRRETWRMALVVWLALLAQALFQILGVALFSA